MRLTVHLEGEQELKAQLEALGRAARGATLERAAMAGAEVIRAEAQRRAPGPHIESEITQAADLAIEVGIGPDKAYWYYLFFETGAAGHAITPATKGGLAFGGDDGPIVRFGVDHPGMAAEPFLRPAIDGQGPAAVAATGAELKRGIDAVARG